MGGRWHNWGRLKQGWSLEVGNAFRCSVVRTYPDGRVVEEAWKATVNHCDLGTFPDAEAAKRGVEESLIFDMKRVLEDWEAFLKDTVQNKRV